MRKLLMLAVSVAVVMGWLAPAEVAHAYAFGEPGVASAVAGDGKATVTWTKPPNYYAYQVPTSYIVVPYRGTTPESPRVFKSSATTGVVTGLTNGGSYRFRVSARIDYSGPLSAMPPESAAIIVGAPAKLNQVTAVPRNGAALLSWSAPVSTNGSPVTGYAVTPIRNGVAQPPVTFPPTARTQTVTGLVNGSSYAFQVAAINARGAGALSSPTPAFVVGAPVAPTGLSVTVGARSVSASWGVPPNNGSALTQYKVWPITGSQTVANTTPRTTTTPSTTLTNLAGGSTYKLVVAAVNARGTGPAVTSGSFVAPKPLALAPGTPITSPGNAQASAMWGAPSDTGGVPITSYKVTPIKNGTRQGIRTVTPTSGGGFTTVTGLVNGATYTFVVAAVTSYGTGAESAPSAPIRVGAPGATSIGSMIVNVADGSATLTWPAPSVDNGSPVTGYVITPFRSGIAQPAVTVPAAPLTTTVTGLDNPFEYRFSIAATNARGTGPASSPGPTALASAPGTPSVPINALVGRSTTMHGTFWVGFWEPPASDGGSPITGYTVVMYTTTSAGTTMSSVSYEANETFAFLEGVNFGAITDFYMIAHNANGAGVAAYAGRDLGDGDPFPF